MGRPIPTDDELVGGIPVGECFEMAKYVGRGGLAYLFMLANGIHFEETRNAHSTPQSSADRNQIAERPGDHPMRLPVLELGETTLSGHIPIVRYMSRKIGLYGKDANADYEADRVADEYLKWRNAWASHYSDGNETTHRDYVEARESRYKLFEYFYSRRNASFHGDTQTPNFEDAAVFSIMYDDQWYFGRTDLSAFPNLMALWNGLMAIQEVKEWLGNREAAHDRVFDVCLFRPGSVS